MTKSILLFALLTGFTFGIAKAQLLKEDGRYKQNSRKIEPRLPDEVKPWDTPGSSVKTGSDRSDIVRLRSGHKEVRKVERNAKAENKAVVRIREQEQRKKNKVYRELPKRRHVKFYRPGAENKFRS